MPVFLGVIAVYITVKYPTIISTVCTSGIKINSVQYIQANNLCKAGRGSDPGHRVPRNIKQDKYNQVLPPWRRSPLDPAAEQGHGSSLHAFAIGVSPEW